MIWPLLETLDFIEPHLPLPGSVGTSWTGIRRIATSLPQAVSASFLEYHLSDAAERVDFLACVFSPSGGARQLAAHFAAHPEAARRDPAWCHVEALSTVWNKPGTVFHEAVPFLWLEFDNPAVDHRDAPSVSVCTDPTTLVDPLWRGFTQRLAAREIVEEMLDRAVANPVHGEQRAVVLDCLHHLPEGGSLVHFASMLPRLPPLMKLNVALPRGGLLPYLNAIGWTGNGSWVEEVLEAWCPSMTTLKIDLAIADKIQPYLGIEFLQESEWTVLLDRCVEEGLCSGEARNAIRAWPGSTQDLYDGQTWRTRLSRWTEVKLLCRPDQTLAVKAYLGFQPHFSLF